MADLSGSTRHGGGRQGRADTVTAESESTESAEISVSVFDRRPV